MDVANFAARLRELRIASGKSQAEIAEEAGTSVRSLSKLETGKQEPTWPIVVALAKVLGVECTEFLETPTTKQDAPRRGRPRKDEKQWLR